MEYEIKIGSEWKSLYPFSYGDCEIVNVVGRRVYFRYTNGNIRGHYDHDIKTFHHWFIPKGDTK